MELQLKNIGMIKESSVRIKGLTVIAGENDKGKSTVGKMLFSIIKSDNISQTQNANAHNAKRILATRLNLVFDGNISYNGKAILKSEKNEIITEIQIRDKNYISMYDSKHKNSERFFDVTFVQSPIVFDMIDFFNSVSRMRDRGKFELGLDFDVSYPYMMWDLYDKLSRENPYPHARRQQKIKNMITKVIAGNLEFDSSKFYYHKIVGNSAIKVEMENTASGIKSFGIIQVLNDNKFFVRKNLLILDEPEVHLHPKWQLKMAKVVVELVKNGVKILVNTHSPYMIEALQRYSEIEQVTSDFYLAEDGYIKKENNNNSETLAKIFEKLSEPFDIFEEMDSQSMGKLING